MNSTKKKAFNDFFKLDFPSVNSFEEAERLYRETAPLRGKRLDLDIRPVGSSRRQTRFQIRKISEDEYSLVATYNRSLRDLKYKKIPYGPWPKLYPDIDRMLSYHRDGRIVIHCPVGTRRLVLDDYRNKPWAIYLNPTNQNWNIHSQVLPRNMHVETHGRRVGEPKTYLAIVRPKGTEYYLLPNVHHEIALERDGAGRWRVVNPIEESVKLLPDWAKELTRKAYKDFWRFAEVYWELVRIDTEGSRAPGYSYLSILRNMIERPRKALEQLKWISPIRYTPEQNIKLWRKEVRKQFYDGLPDAEYEFRKVPLGQMCGHHRYRGGGRSCEEEIPF
jgi:hypothetical protein